MDKIELAEIEQTELAPRLYKVSLPNSHELRYVLVIYFKMPTNLTFITCMTRINGTDCCSQG